MAEEVKNNDDNTKEEKFNEVKESGKKPKLFQKKEVKSRALPDQEEKVREVKKA